MESDMTKPDIDISPEAVATFVHKWGSKGGALESFLKALAADRDRLAKERDEAIRSLEQCREGRRIIATGAFDAGILTAISIGELEDAKADISAAIARAEKAEVERDDAAEQIHLLRGCLSADAQLLSAAIARAERAEAERDEARRRLGAST